MFYIELISFRYILKVTFQIKVQNSEHFYSNNALHKNYNFSLVQISDFLLYFSTDEEISEHMTDDLGNQFTEIFIKKSDNVGLLLSLLEVMTLSKELLL